MATHSKENYRRLKDHTLRRILRRNLPLKISEDEEPFCQICKKRKSEVEELHVEHPDGNGGGNIGGWQSLESYIKQFDNGKRLYVVCDVCHYLLHKRRGDNHDIELLNNREHLREYEDVDPEFEIRKRVREGEIYE